MMRVPRVPAALTVLAAGALAWAAARGELRAAIVLVFPALTGTGPVAFLGILLLFAAMVAWMLAFTRGLPADEQAPAAGAPVAPERARPARHAGVVVVGPVPIVWGTDKRLALAVALAALGIMVAAWLLSW